MSIQLILSTLTAYLICSIPAAYLAASWFHGIDIRQYGSGNVGVSNLWKLTSKRLAIGVSLFDLGKGMVMVWAAQRIGLGIAEQVVVALAAIAGHNWPIFLRFSGGRGILTTLGIAIILPAINSLVPWAIIVALAIAAIGVPSHNIPPAVAGGLASLPLVSWAVQEPLALTLGFVAIFLMTIIRRLTAPAPSVASVSKGELFINRLLFDRDIRDRKAWIYQAVPEMRKHRKKEGNSH